MTEINQLEQPRRRKKKRSSSAGVPYAGAITSKAAARAETEKILVRLGCEGVGFFDDFDKQEVLLQFKQRGRMVQLAASAKGWAAMWLKAHPYSGRHRRSRVEYERWAIEQGHIAVNAALRDWIKGQVTAIECGILSFEAVFLPFMLTHDGRPLIERAADLIPKPDEPKVVSLNPPRPGG